MTYEQFKVYARVKCGAAFPETALCYVNERLRDIKHMTLKEADFLLSIKQLLEK